MVKRPSAKWTGVLSIPDLNLKIDGGLYTANGKRRPLPFLQVHATCQTALQEPEPNEREKKDGGEEEDASSGESPVQTTRQIHCPVCQKPVMADEIEYAVDTRIGRIRVDPQERAALKPQRLKAIEGQIVNDCSSLLTTVGTGRRFYVFPKADSVETYYLLLRTLQKAKKMVFVKEIVVDKRAYVLVIHAVQMDPDVFGSSRIILVADELCDTEVLKNPDDFQLLPAEEPVVAEDSIVDLAREARRSAKDVNLADCVNPEQSKFREFVRRKMQAILDTQRVLV